MSKIIAVGGGEIGRPGFTFETIKIDKEIIKLSGKKSPKLLFIPTASSDSESYYEVVKKYFGKKLSCRVDVLYLIKKQINFKEIKDKILNADIIYVGGGNTLKMMNVWKRIGVDKILRQAYKKNIVLSGVSAGAICWFKYGNSDSRKFTAKKQTSLIKVSGLGFFEILLCPHYDREVDRKESLKKMTKKSKEVALALDNCSAIEIVNDKYRIITSKKTAKAYKVYWQNNCYIEEPIKVSSDFKPIKTLTLKGSDSFKLIKRLT